MDACVGVSFGIRALAQCGGANFSNMFPVLIWVREPETQETRVERTRDSTLETWTSPWKCANSRRRNRLQGVCAALALASFLPKAVKAPLRP